MVGSKRASPSYRREVKVLKRVGKYTFLFILLFLPFIKPPSGYTSSPFGPMLWFEVNQQGEIQSKYWKIQLTPQGEVFQARTHPVENSYLLTPLEKTPAFVIRFSTYAPDNPRNRGLTFGLSQGYPSSRKTPVLLLAFLGNNTFSYYDGATWRPLFRYTPGLEYHFVLRVDIPLAEARIQANDISTPPFLFTFPSATVEYFFFHNWGSGDLVTARDFSWASGIPAPVGLSIKFSGPREVVLSWDYPYSVEVQGFWIERSGLLLGAVSPQQRTFRDYHLPVGRGYAYTLRAFTGQPLGDYAYIPETMESLPTWPVTVYIPAYPELPTADLSQNLEVDVMVYGGTPAGVTSAIASAEEGAKVLLVLHEDRVGGMMSGGLGITDLRYRQTMGGLFKRFVSRVRQFYEETYGKDSFQFRDCNEGLYFEPGVAEALLREMIGEQPRIRVAPFQQLKGVKRQKVFLKRGFNQGFLAFYKPAEALLQDRRTGRRSVVRAKIFIDASYEGDLSAMAGVRYRIGRESAKETGEEYAGEVYWSWETMEKVAGSGEGDRRIQAYNYRVTLTNRPTNRVAILRPSLYSLFYPRYLPIAEDVRQGRITSIRQGIYFGRLPNDKYDINNMGRYWPSTDFIGENYDYPETGPEARRWIARRHREYLLGLLYFMQNDPSLPESFREEARQWGLPKDEYLTSGHFPPQLYVREARRIVGYYTFKEQDARSLPGQERAPIHSDSIAVADYPLDSHATRNREPEHPQELEGFFYLPRITVPSQIPYRILLPQHWEGLLVSCAVSATHVGYGTLRLEPIYMAMGEACGVSAGLSLRRHIPLTFLPVRILQEELLRRGCKITFFRDVGEDAPDFLPLQLWGTQGFFEGYFAWPEAPVEGRTALRWWVQAWAYSDPRIRSQIYSHQSPEGITLAQIEEGIRSFLQRRGIGEESLLSGKTEVSVEDLQRWLSLLPFGRRPGGLKGFFKNPQRITRGELCRLLWEMVR